MAANQKGEVTIELDRPRTLIFKHNEMADAEEVLGKPVAEALVAGMSYDTMRKLLWAGLKRFDPTMTNGDRAAAIRRCGDLIDLAPGTLGSEKVSYVAGKLVDAINTAQFGIDLEALRKNAGDPAQAGTTKESPGAGGGPASSPSASSA